MASKASSWLGKHSLYAYFVLAYAITWAFEIPLAAAGQEWIESGIPFGIHYLGGFGPMLAALIVTAIIQGRSGIRDLLSGLLKWRVGAGWILFSLLSPFAMFALAAVAMRRHLDYGPTYPCSAKWTISRTLASPARSSSGC